MRAKEFARHIFEQVKSNWYIPVTEHQVYSTAEQKVGVWTDGKPLYSKVIASPTQIKVGDVALNWTTIMSAGVSNAVLVKCEAFNSIYSSTRNVPVSYRLYEGNLQYYSPSVLPEYNITSFILYYTKTTDTATSPKVSYEPLHEWSTEEKLVGYWINGQAVYEKTVTGTTPSTQNKGISTGLTGIDQAWIEQLLLKNTSGYTANLGYRDCFTGIKNDGSEIWFDISQPAFLSQPFIATLRYTKTT